MAGRLQTNPDRIKVHKTKGISVDQVNWSLPEELLLIAATVAIAVAIWFATCTTLGTLGRFWGFIGERWRARRHRLF